MISQLLRSLKTQRLPLRIAQKHLKRAQSMIKIKLTQNQKMKKKIVMSFTCPVS